MNRPVSQMRASQGRLLPSYDKTARAAISFEYLLIHAPYMVFGLLTARGKIIVKQVYSPVSQFFFPSGEQSEEQRILAYKSEHTTAGC